MADVVVLMNISMPKLNGTQFAKEIYKHCPRMAIIMLNALDYDAFILTSLRPGAREYILKTPPLNKIISTVRLVIKGIGWLI